MAAPFLRPFAGFLPGPIFLCMALMLGSAGANASSAQCNRKDQSAAALAEAETAVANAAAAGALWLPAQEAMERARRAHAGGDFGIACREAGSARDFARMGIDQLKLPLYER